MLERFRNKLWNRPSKLELKEMNTSLIYKNSELVNTLEELRLENLKLQKNYDELVSVINEILAKPNNDQSMSSLNLKKIHQLVDTEDSLAGEEINNNSVD